MVRRNKLNSSLLPVLLLIQAASLEAFAVVPITSAFPTLPTSAIASSVFQRIHDPRLLPDVASSSFGASSSSVSLSAVTVDPTSFLNDLFAGVSGTPELLLAVPILAALGLVSVLAYAIISYANPAEPDD